MSGAFLLLLMFLPYGMTNPLLQLSHIKKTYHKIFFTFEVTQVLKNELLACICAGTILTDLLSVFNF